VTVGESIACGALLLTCVSLLMLSQAIPERFRAALYTAVLAIILSVAVILSSR
jgi:hypothetical protein